MTAKLTDVTVEKLGLVTDGANQETFFLLKSEDVVDGAPVANAIEPLVEGTNTEQVAEQVADQVTKSVWQKLLAIFKAATAPVDDKGPLDETEPDDVCPDCNKPMAECVCDKPIAKTIETTTNETLTRVSNVVTKNMEEPIMSDIEMVAKAQYDLLSGTVDDLKTRLAKAEALAETARDQQALNESIAKAQELAALPINPTELGTNLWKLAKADAQLAIYFDAVLKASDRLLWDLGIFGERGTDKVADQTDPVLKAAQSANPREALLNLNKRDAAKYVAMRQAATSGRRM